MRYIGKREELASVAPRGDVKRLYNERWRFVVVGGDDRS